ncbi:MAG: TonB-dependent receptor [Enterobacterales bacterium]|nr:TonB-dependent receptor [Enterobacterales bacterium]
MMYSKRISLLAVAICSASAYAQDHKSEDMVVTANRVEQSIGSVLAPVTVFNRAKIEATQANDIYDVLKLAPGVQLNRTGGKGSATSLYVRGSNSDHVLIMVDGVRYESATLGSAALESIAIDQVERIEIVRAPRSSLYGSDAISGVVQIFTRKAAAESGTIVSVGYGSEDTQQVATHSTFAYGDGSVMLSLNYEKTDGIDARYADDDGKFGDDKDDSDSKDIAVKWNHQLSKGFQFTWSNYYSQDEALYDNRTSSDASPYSVKQNAKSTFLIDAKVTDFWDLEVQLGYVLDDSLNYDRNVPGQFDSATQIKTDRFQHSVTNVFDVSDTQTVVAGIDYVEDKVEADQGYQEDERENVGTFVQYIAQYGDVSVSVGARYDDNEEFGGYETGNVAVGYTFSPMLETVLSFGTAFKSPTFNDLYWPANAFGAGNPDLEPEESKNVELQFRGDLTDNQSYELNIFQNEIENLIEWAPAPTAEFPWRWTPTNVSEARITGVEFVYAASFDLADLAFNTTYTEPKDLNNNEDLRRRSRWNGSLDISKAAEFGKVGVTFNASSDKKGAEKLPGYGTVDFRVEKAFTNALVAKLKVDNIFDNEFIQADGYNDQGRFALIELQYKFKH